MKIKKVKIKEKKAGVKKIIKETGKTNVGMTCSG